MPTTTEIVDFLEEKDCLRLENPPWPTTATEEGDHYLVDWDRIFGGTPHQDGEMPWELSRDEWEIPGDAPAGILDGLIESLGHRPPHGVSADQLPEDVLQPERRNWDVCAWYQPIHFYAYGWGIYIREVCLLDMARRIARFVRFAPFSPFSNPRNLNLLAKAILRASFSLYFLHEHYHHKTECLGLRLHVIDRNPLYLDYFNKVYARTIGTDDQLEEALANAQMYRRVHDAPYGRWISRPIIEAVEDYLTWSFPLNPPGYRKAVDYLTVASFSDGENLLQAQMRERTSKPIQPISDWNMAPRLLQSFMNLRSNIWTILPPGQMSVLPVKVLPLRTCSTGQMTKICINKGYSQVLGGKGSHVKLKKEGRPSVVIPGDRDNLSPGVAREVLKVLGSYTIHDIPRLARGEL